MKGFKNLSNFKLHNHLIYAVVAMLIGILTNAGSGYLIFALLVYVRRFPKTYWIYFLIFILSFSLYRLIDEQTVSTLRPLTEGDNVKVLEIQHQSDEKQTAIIEFNQEKIYFTTSQIEPKLVPGDVIGIEGTFKSPMKSTIPHGFNFKQYLNNEGISYTIWSDSFEWIDHAFTVKQWQYQLAHLVEQQFPPLVATYVKAWGLGITDQIEDEVHDSYSELGIIHLFAISGLHIGLISLLLSYGLKRIGMIEELSQIIIGGVLILFIIISGASPSVVRAGMMTVFFILNKRFQPKFSSLDIFSMVLILNILINPRQVYQIGFMYSYWISFVLICFQTTFKQMNSMTLFFFVPFIAQLASVPLQLYFNYEWNVLSYLPNLMLIPFVSVFLLPFILMTLFFPILSNLTEMCLYVFERVVSRSSNFISLNWVSGSLSIFLVFVLVMIFLWSCYRFEKTKSFLIWVGCIMMSVLSIEVNRFLVIESRMTMLDVGQGDSFVIQSPFWQCQIVVDTGGEYQYNGKSKEIFSSTLQPYLKGEGVRVIDYLILTHGDFDHVGEAISLLKTFKVKQLLINQQPLNDLMVEIEKVAMERGTVIRRMNQKEVITCGNQRWTFLQSNEMKSNENDASLVMTLEIDAFSALLTGDISMGMESEILKQYSLNELTVYKVAHHGSATSNSLNFMTQLAPRIALVSSGRNNRYNHPSQVLVNQMNELNVPLLNTQIVGSVQVLISKNGYQIDSYPPYD